MVLTLYIMAGVINMLSVMNDYYIPNTPELRDIRVRRNAQLEPYATVHKGDNSINVRRIFSGEYFKERAKRNSPVYPQTGYVNQVNNSWSYGGAYPGYYNVNFNTTGSNGYNMVNGNKYPNGVYYNGYSGVPYYYRYPGNNTQPGYGYPVYAPYPNNTYPGYSNPGNSPYPGNLPNTINVTHPGYNSNLGKNSNPGNGSNLQNNKYQGYRSSSNYNTNTYSPYNPNYALPGSTTPPSTTTPRIDKSCIICNIGCPGFMKRIGYICVEDDDYS